MRRRQYSLGHDEAECPPLIQPNTRWDNLRLKIFNAITVDERHPNTLEYFRSQISIYREKKRHLSKYKYIIHPLSMFKIWYDFYCIFLYGALLFIKPFEASFVRTSVIYQTTRLSEKYVIIIGCVMDILSFVNIVFQFFIGFCEPKTKEVELSIKKIAKKYVLSCYFAFDVLSSIPRLAYDRSPILVFSLINLCCNLKLIRLKTWVLLVKTSSGINSSVTIFLVIFFFITSIVSHFMTCLHFAVPRYFRIITQSFNPDSWVSKSNILNATLFSSYVFTHFRSSGYTMGIMTTPYSNVVWEDVIVTVINCIVGKILMVSTWIVLLSVFLSTRTLKTKYQETLTELNEFMKNKQMPSNLRKRLIAYYSFKYQNVFFNDHTIKSVLSRNLKEEISVFLSKSVLTHVKLFSYMNAGEVKELVSYLIPEIYLPNDVIMNYGNYQDCMYFIANGTIAVYTISGKEVCHLHDGAYFGEVNLIFEKRRKLAKYIAIEVAKLYKLEKKHFKKCFLENPVTYDIIKTEAEKKIKLVQKLDDDYNQDQFMRQFN